MIYARKRPPQRLFRRDQLRVCGARSNTEIVDEAQYSASFVWVSLSNTVSFLEVFGVDRVRSTVHNWVHTADLQPETRRSPNHVAVDETAIQLDDEQYWLYAAVDQESNNLLHTKLEPTRNNAFVDLFFAELCEKHNVDDAIFSLMAQLHFSELVRNTISILDTNDMEIGTVSNVSFMK